MRLLLLLLLFIYLITLVNIYLLRRLHLSQIVSGISLSQGKEIHPIP